MVQMKAIYHDLLKLSEGPKLHLTEHRDCCQPDASVQCVISIDPTLQNSNVDIFKTFHIRVRLGQAVFL
jgi:hypothetical protein